MSDGGMRKRIGLAALVSKPEILFYDDNTANEFVHRFITTSDVAAAGGVI